LNLFVNTILIIRHTGFIPASYGDLVTYEINQDKNPYVTHNEAAGQDDSGNYEVKDGSLGRIYEVVKSGKHFFAVLDEKIIAANFSSGRSKNDISFGINSDIDNSGKEREIMGR